jgi:Cu+-exporting ATPase
MSEIQNCFHCGDICTTLDIKTEDKFFCCSGCKTVFEILNQSGLDTYYNLEMDADKRKRSVDAANKYEFLDDEEIQEKILDFKIGNKSQLIVDLPDIHCSACLYLLENIYKINPAVLESKVNFIRKEATILFDNENLSLRKLAEILHSIGYPPKFNLSSVEGKKDNPNRLLYFKLAAAGFAFGNVMLFAFPDYLSGGTLDEETKKFLSYISLFLSPVVLYASIDYFRSAWAGLKVKHINIDVPISIGIVVLFLRSAFEIISDTGTGYIDSLTGLIFFLLIGKVFQKKTYEKLSFENDYSAYFPLSVTVKGKNGVKDKVIALTKLKAGDRIVLKNEDIIPNNSMLFSDKCFIDYSYVSGESKIIEANKGEKLYAGGKIVGSMVELDVLSDFDKDHLNKIWLGDDKINKSNNLSRMSDNVAKYFTIIVLAIAFGSFIFWYNTDPAISWDTLTAVLIITCPCALAMTIPFTYGTSFRLLSKHGLFIKEPNIIETISRTKKIVFDKTGTLTDTNDSEIEYYGKEIPLECLSLIKTGVENSNHPLSKMLFNFLKIEKLTINNFEELPGLGISIKNEKYNIRIGNKNWLNYKQLEKINESTVVIEIDGELYGYYIFKQKYRNGIFVMMNNLISTFNLYIISGDNDAEKEHLKSETSDKLEMKFNMLPNEKYQFINQIKEQKTTTLMIGDGLNDAGALKNADVGISVSNDSSSFTPGSDAIILGSKLQYLNYFLNFIKSTRYIVISSFVFSFLYNIVGLSYAVTGNLSPIVAAILMPLSSITIIIYTTVSSIFISKLKLKSVI